MRRMWHWLTAAIALSVGLGLAVNGWAGALDDIKKRGKIIIGVKADYVPYGFTDPSGKVTGLEIDKARYIALRLTGSENNLELVPVVAANRIEFLRQGRIDLILATMSDTAERREVIDFSVNHYSSGTNLLTRKDSGIKSWDDVKGKHKVCGIQGAFYNKPLTDMGVSMVNFAGTADVYKALQDGRCQAFAYDDSAIIGKLQDPAWTKDYHMPAETILATPWGMGIRKGDTEFKKAIDAIVMEWHRSGFILALETKWGISNTGWARQAHEKASK